MAKTAELASLPDPTERRATARTAPRAPAARRRAAAWLLAAWATLACGAEPTTPEPPPRADDGAPATADGASTAPSRPGRIILVSMDTVRADRVGGGSRVDDTPRLAEIAAEGVRFDRFYTAASYTLPATMSIFTGLDPIEHGVWTGSATLAPGVATLAERLADAGYTTVGLHEGGFVAAPYGFDRGFRNYEAFDPRQVVESALPTLLAWMRSAGANPYFLFLHTYAAHAPYGGFARYREEAPERGLPSDAELAALRERYPRRGPEVLSPAAEAPAATRVLCSLYNQLRQEASDFLGCGYNTLSSKFSESEHFASDRAALLASYDARIREIDTALGKIRDLLVSLDQWDDTLLVVTSDHGEAFFEHGLYQHDLVPFEEVLKIPLIVSWPARLRDGGVRQVDALAWHLDLMPTLLSLAGAAPPAGLSGVDLTPLLTGVREDLPGRTLYPAVFRVPRGGPGVLRRVALAGDEKYIEGDPAFGDAEGLLYDLSQSPGETENLRTERPERFRALSEDTRRYAASLTPIPALDRKTGVPITAAPEDVVESAQLPPEEEAALRALGYRD